MKTAVLMQRPLFGGHISQHSKFEMFSETDLVKVGNAWRFANKMHPFKVQQWLKQKGTKEFIACLEKEYGKENVRKSARGRGKHTWIHPLLFIDMALAISPQLKVEAYKWLYDCLIKARNRSGESYIKMCGALYSIYPRKSEFSLYAAKVADQIRLACGVDDWQQATEAQLEKRNEIHNNIALLASVMNNPDEAVRIALVRSIG